MAVAHTHNHSDRLAPLLEGLNAPQRQAVTTTDGPLLVLAGPGSGKTRVITRRAAYIAQTVAKPWQILAITFTNKAAKEMQERVHALHVGRGISVCTFHALGARLLREFHERAGLARNYTILDREDRRKALKLAIERCNLAEHNWTPAKIEPVISVAKNNLQTAAEFAAKNDDWQAKTIARIYAAYEALLHETASLDFDDLLMQLARLLQRDADVRATLQDRFRYILIDEYQDTNGAQYQITQMLAERYKNICATGDPDQSIYGWRGADIGNILSFERDYPDAQVVRLEENYRSTKRILAAADSLIGHNVHRKAKSLFTENHEGERIRVLEFETAEDEADGVCQDIARRVSAGTSPREIAVFYRINAMSRGMEESLLRSGISYQIARGVEFYNRKEIKDVLAYLRVLHNPADDVALRRIFNTPARGIGDTTVDRLAVEAQRRGCPLLALIRSDDCASIAGRSAPKVQQFVQLLAHLANGLSLPPHEAIDFVVSHSGLHALYSHQRSDEGSPLDNITELANAAAEFHVLNPESTIQQWLEHTALMSDIDSVRDERGAVTLMTLHAAKGLEFDVVYLLGMEDGMLPFYRRDAVVADAEEERRLAFVGITRARKHLTLTHARYRMVHGITERAVESPFLDELPPEQIEWVRLDDPVSKRSRRLGALPNDVTEWSVGTVVRHPLHGIGQIRNIVQSGRRTHVDVVFKRGGLRTMILEFAQLERVDFDELE